MEEELKKNLEDAIRKLNREYAEGTVTVPDSEYDALLEQLRSIDPGNPLCTEVQRNVVEGGGKVEYGDDPMLSMQKLYDAEALVKWARQTADDPGQEVLLQPKYDGISAQWDGHVLSTRGDGHAGQDITSKARFFLQARLLCGSGSVPSLCHCPLPDARVRGELICSKDDFEKVRQKLVRKDGSRYSNGRNFVAGLCNPTTAAEDDDRLLRTLDEAGVQLSFVDHDMTSIRMKVSELTAEAVLAAFRKFRQELPFEQDGLVVKFVGDEFRKKLGSTDHHPRWACAFKQNAEGTWCRVTGCEWTVGQDGSLTPTLKVEPTEIGGVLVSNVLAHSFQYVKENEIAVDGHTWVSVVRSGDVIPFICGVRNDPGTPPWSGREVGLVRDSAGNRTCPECGTPIVYEGGQVDAYCVNESCPGRLKKRIYNAASKCFEIKGLAESTIAKLYDRFKVRSFYQLLDLSPDDLATLDGFAWDSAVKLWNAVHSAVEKATDVQVLASLGIRLIGRHVASDLLARMPLSVLREAQEDALCDVDGVGAEKARSLVGGLRRRSRELDELLDRIPNLRQTYSAAKKAAAEGKVTVCFTGEAPLPRSKCQEIARLNGYEPVSGVSKSLGVLVCASADSNSTKAQKARKYGTKVVQFDEWFSSLAVKDVPLASPAGHGNAAVDSILEGI